MRIPATLAVIACCGSPASAEWSDYKTIATKPGPAATYGCAAVSEDEAWLCIALQCDAPGAVGAYFIVAGGADLSGRWPLAVGGKRFFLGEAGHSGAGRFDYRIGPATPDFLAALKSGKEIMLEAPAGRVNKGYDRIPLAKASAEVARLERACDSSRRG